MSENVIGATGLVVSDSAFPGETTTVSAQGVVLTAAAAPAVTLLRENNGVLVQADTFHVMPVALDGPTMLVEGAIQGQSVAVGGSDGAAEINSFLQFIPYESGLLPTFANLPALSGARSGQIWLVDDRGTGGSIALCVQVTNGNGDHVWAKAAFTVVP